MIRAVLFNHAGSPARLGFCVIRSFLLPSILYVLQLAFIRAFFFTSTMASTLGLLAATLTLLSSALAFSPDQCNVTTYGAPDRVACNTLLTNIAKLGVGNTSYLFIPSQFPTPAGLSNGTRKNFPQTWSSSKFLSASFDGPGDGTEHQTHVVNSWLQSGACAH